jgi:hypothetical protein
VYANVLLLLCSVALALWVLMYLVLLRSEAARPSDDGGFDASVYNGFLSIGLVMWMKLSESTISFMASFEKHHSYSAADLSILRNRFGLEAMHYCAVFIVLFWSTEPIEYGDIEDRRARYPGQYHYWYTRAAPILGSMYVSEAVFYVVLAFLPGFTVRKWVARLVSETQEVCPPACMLVSLTC